MLIVGDLNSYAKEDPIRALEAAGFTNLVNQFVGAGAYSYVFDGQWGYLDHALGSRRPGLPGHRCDGVPHQRRRALGARLQHRLQVGRPQVDSLYAPDQFRVSDHDPIVVGLQPNSAATVTAAFDDTSVACGSGNASLTVDITDRDEADTHTATIDVG